MPESNCIWKCLGIFSFDFDFCFLWFVSVWYARWAPPFMLGHSNKKMACIIVFAALLTMRGRGFISRMDMLRDKGVYSNIPNGFMVLEIISAGKGCVAASVIFSVVGIYMEFPLISK